MVYLLTRPTDDTTILVIQWLIHFKKKFERLSFINELIKLGYDSGGIDLNIGCDLYNATNSFYFNGGKLTAPPLQIDDKELNVQISRFLENEAATIFSFLGMENELNKTFGLNPTSEIKVNKIKVLKEASEIGLNIPPTKVVVTRKALQNCKESWGRIINKSIDNGINIHTSQYILNGQQTIEVTEDLIESMAEEFLPSLVQKLIEKEFEIRVFYFQKGIQAIAIFSQSDEQTRIDGRQDKSSSPIRHVPFNLPEDLRNKITKLMENIGLNYGSLDFIYTVDQQYCFLEVNPYGQYGFLSSAGNFYIEKQIAEYL